MDGRLFASHSDSEQQFEILEDRFLEEETLIEPNLIIIGASARAAACSARLAGYSVHAIDLFADRDLREIATCQRLPFEEYPQGFLRLLERAPPGPVMYTGGLENHPDLIEEIGRSRPIVGNHGESLRRVRNPFFVHNLLKKRGLPTLEVEVDRPHHGDWLWKPYRSSAGFGIRHSSPSETATGEGYYQRYATGSPHSALYYSHESDSSLLALFRQLIGTPWLNAPAFRYAGNIGPICVSNEIRSTLEDIGRVIANECQLRGIFGIDLLLEGNQPWLCEVNPRYTASVELFELATGQAVLRGNAKPIEPKFIVGKAILYAPRRMTFSELRRDESFADVPDASEIIEAGMPVCTRIVQGNSEAEVEAKLRQAWL